MSQIAPITVALKAAHLRFNAASSFAISLLCVAVVALGLSPSANAAVVTANFSTSTDIPITGAAYTATGNTVNITMTFAPTTGTTLTIVKTTGLGFISGTFDNLAQGQTVVLPFGTANYVFVANYFGGTGNDLVLQWAGVRPLAWGSNSTGQLGNNATTNSLVPAAVAATGVLASKTIMAFAAGGSHSLALCTDGTLAAWGDNTAGQLGNNSTTQSLVPVAVVTTGALLGKTVVSIAAGDRHSMAQCSDGTLFAWGDNSSGQLGNNSNSQSLVPVAVTTTGVLAGKTVVAVTAGKLHTLALLSDGTLAAWGDNTNGQLGNNSTTGSLVPVAVTATGVLSGKIVTAVTAGMSHNLALTSTGTVVAWGLNSNGQLGNNTTTQSLVPVAVSTAGLLAGKTVTAISAGGTHSVALAISAVTTVATWGLNSSGQLGNNTTTQSLVPVAVTATGVLTGKTVTSIGAGFSHTTALCSDGTLTAWGNDSFGQLGNNSTTNSLVPVAVSTTPLVAGERFIAGASGSAASHTLGIVAQPLNNNTLLSGLNTSEGAVSPAFVGTTTSYSVSVPDTTTSIQLIPTVADPYASVKVNGVAITSGSASPSVNLRYGDTSIPVVVTAQDGSTTRAYTVTVTRALSPSMTISWSAGTDVPVWVSSFTAAGRNISMSLNYAPGTGTTLTLVKNTGVGFINGRFNNLAQGQTVAFNFGGDTYTFVVNYYGGTGNDLVLVWAGARAFDWGGNTNGQLGIGSTSDSTSPAAVTSTGILAAKTVIAVAAGASHSLGVCSDGTLASWGANATGQLGNNSTTQSPVPVAVSSIGALAGKTVIAVAAGTSHSLVLSTDGTVNSWGANASGQLGNNSTTQSTVPVAVTAAGVLTGKTVVAIAAGDAHSIALCSDGTVAAWGANASGQLGNNSTTPSSVPVAVTITGALAGKTVVAIAAGGSHSLAVLSDGTVAAWGANTNGQLGNNSTTPSSVPVAVTITGVLAGRTVTSLAAGLLHSLALCSDGTLATWGANANGQLGNNSTTQSLVPVAVTRTGVLVNKTAIFIAAGANHCLAFCADNTLAAWGIGARGQLGNGGTAQSTVPVITPTPGGGSVFTATASGPLAVHTSGLVAASLPVYHNALLTNLVPSASSLAPSFAGNVTAYTLRVPDTTTSIQLTPTVSEPHAAIAVNGATVASGNPSTTINLPTGDTLIRTVVTAQDGVTTQTYTITVSRRLHNDAITANFTSATTVPFTAAGFTATGTSVNFTLGYAPATGSTLTIAKITGADFIKGTLTNLVQGQKVPLTFAGVSYYFVANYFGGSGNDLVLQWDGISVMDWGANANGQLGNDSAVDSAVPVPVTTAGVLADKTITSVAVGEMHAIALCADGTLADWGSNSNGQLGNNTNADSSIPVATVTTGVLAGKTVIAVAAGYSHSLALCSDGTVAAWGANGNGQLGNNSTSDSWVPVAVNNSGVLAGKTVVMIAAGGSHSLALCSDATLVAWGSNFNGQLGNNSTTQSLVPTAVVTTGVLAGKTIVNLAAGGSHNLALCSDGTLAVWGANFIGQLGSGSVASSLVPVGITGNGALGGKVITAIAAGVFHSMALCSDSTVATWGGNFSGELGNNTYNDSVTPVAVLNTGVLKSKSVVSIAAGGEHCLALCSDGTLASWGFNGNGQLGNSVASGSPIPVTVSTASLAAGSLFVAPASGLSASFSIGLVAQVPVITNALLKSLAVSTGSLAPVFSSDTTTYSINVSDSTAAIQLTPTVADTYATVKVNGVTVPSGSASGSISLPYSDTLVPIVVTARDGLTTRTYNVTVTRPLPNNTLTANFNAATDIPVATGALTATGNIVNISLNYAPVPGTTLTVVKNTGLSFIKGTFSNLAQGQKIVLPFGGENYLFVANYYGGTGNDLVLQWAGTRLMGWGENSVGQLGNNSPSYSGVPTFADSTGLLAGKTILSVACGLNHNLALCSDGAVVSWGSNASGQLGNNGTTNSVSPIAVNASGVLASKTVIAIAAGETHSLALCSDGTLAAWGDNSNGQLGNSSTTNSLVPIAVSNTGALAGKTVVSISAGQSHSMALCSDGTLATWGLNNGGQAVSTMDLVPVVVSGTGVLTGKTVVGIASGYWHNLALCSDGTLGSWGDNTYGQLGNNSTTRASTPVAVTSTGALAGKIIVGITAGFGHSLALCSDGTLTAWGANDVGQLGNNSTTNSLVPLAVLNSGALAGKTIVATAAGYRHSLALCSDGTLTAWGANDLGQLGNDSTTGSLAPVAVSTASLAVGDRFGPTISGPTSRHSFSLVAPGPPSYQNAKLASLSISSDTLDPLFNSDTTAYNVSVPATTASIQVTPTVAQSSATIKVNGAPVLSATASTDISLNYGDTAIPIIVTARDGVSYRAYTITVSRALPGNSLEAGFGAATDVPLTVAGLNATGNSVSIALNYAPAPGTNLMIVRNTGLNFIKGTFSNLAQGQRVDLAFGGQTYYFVANYFGGNGNDLVIQWVGVHVMEWGRNSYGQLGNDSTSDSLVPVAVITNGLLAGKTIIALAAGNNHTLALCSDGVLASWGDNSYGQLGNGSTTPSHVPVAVRTTGSLSGKTVIAVATGNHHSLALCSDGTVAAWGENAFGQLGNNSLAYSTEPTAVDATGVLANKTVVAISAGNHHNVVLCSDGTLAAWGANDHGQLGSGSRSAVASPVAVTTIGLLAGKTATSIAAGGEHSLALCSDGTLAAWGGNFDGQLGNNSTIDSAMPVAVKLPADFAGKTIISIAAGEAHSLALFGDGALAAWGMNAAGQLGNNSTTISLVPVAVDRTGVLAGKTITSVAAGDRHSIAFCSDSTLAAWGSNVGGQLGNNSTTFSQLPAMVSTAGLATGDQFVGCASGPLAYHTHGLVASPSSRIVVSGNNIGIPASDTTPSLADGTDFGTAMQLNAQVTHSFAVVNMGAPFLNLTGPSPIAIGGAAATDFKVVAQAASSLDANTTSAFAITFDPTLPGQRTATVTIASNDPANPSFTFVITGFSTLPTKLPQSIDFSPPATLYLGQGPLTLSASSSAGLPVTFSLVSGPATIAGNLLSLSGAGVVKVQAGSPASGNYTAAATVLRTITVQGNPTALTLVNLNQIYDGKPKPVATLEGGSTPTITYKVGNTYVSNAPASAGSYPVKAFAGTATATGTLTISKAPLYVTPDDKRKFAGQANPLLTVSYTGFVNGESAAVLTKAPVLTTTATGTSIGGIYPITASGATSPNYNFIYRQGTMVVDSFKGNYEALLLDANLVPVGKLTISVLDSSTKYTAKLDTATETTPVPFTGTLLTSNEHATSTATTIIGSTAKATYTINFTLPLYGNVGASATRNGSVLGNSTDGQKISTQPVLFGGAHTAVLEPATPEGTLVPVGAGWATVSASANGVLAIAGKLGDGTAFTATLSPDRMSDPGYRLFSQPYLPVRGQSFLAGTFALAQHPISNRRYLPEQAITWKKTGLAGDVSYRAGFGPVSTVLMIDPWLPPVAATKTVPAISLAQRLGLTGSAISFGVAHSDTGSASDPILPISLGLSAANTVTVPGTTNATKWTTTLVPATGAFTGSFELTDGLIKRPVTFSGVLRQPATLGDNLIGGGHFLLPPKIGTEKTSGEIMFQRP